MNKAYKSIYSEATGTFVAVSENVKAKGKRSSSSKLLSVAAAVAATFAVSGVASADAIVDQAGNAINFTTAGGKINFTGGGSINGLTSLTVNGDNVLTSTDLTPINSEISSLKATVGDATSGLVKDVNDNTTAIGTNTVAIGNLESTVGDASSGLVKDVADINTSLTNLGVSETQGGIKYFRVKSDKGDAQAIGEDAVAIGPLAKAEGDKSLAAGLRAEVTAEGVSAIALGEGAKAGGAALGDGGTAAVAIGRNSIASGTSSVALGDAAQAANSATALGANANASGGNSIAIGNAKATSSNAFAAGNGAFAGSPGGIALGAGAGVGTVGTTSDDRFHHIAIGTNAGQRSGGGQNLAIGANAGSDISGYWNVAIGSGAGSKLGGNSNVSIGELANNGAGPDTAHAVAIGRKTSAAKDAISIGYEASSLNSGIALGYSSMAGEGGLALGRDTKADGGSVALGIGSYARASDATGAGYLTGRDFTDGTVVSVGNSNPDTGQIATRRIVNVEDGAQDNDAVNVRQLKSSQQSVANLVGVDFNGTTGAYGKIKLIDTATGDEVEFNTVVDAIGAINSGGYTPLDPAAVTFNANGQINNVNSGTLDTDAVNVAQLNAAVAENGVKYFSVNSNEPLNRDNTQATGTNAMAIGPSSHASGRSSLASGHLAEAAGHESVAIGYLVEAHADKSTVVGNRSQAYHVGGVAIGEDAESHGLNSIVMGTGARSHPKTAGDAPNNTIVIGTSAEATAHNGIAIGENAETTQLRGIAQGFNAYSSADDAMAFGSNSVASGVSSQASGTGANASGLNAQASGTGANASGLNAVATGTGAFGYATDGIAMGTGAESGFSDPNGNDPARNTAGIAIGNQSKADQEHALALGVEAEARAKSSAAIGDGAKATSTAENGLAVGTNAQVTAEQASAFGSGAEATAKNALALGQGSNASHENSVALGANSTTAPKHGTENNAEYVIGNFAPKGKKETDTGVVSVGSDGQERQIINVAPGVVAADSTDAINGSQLWATNTYLTNLADTTASNLGGETKVGQDGKLSSPNYNFTNDTGGPYTNVGDALTALHDLGLNFEGDGVGLSGQVHRQLGQTLSIKGNASSTATLTDGNIAVIRNDAKNGYDIKLNKDINLTDAGSVVIGATAVNNNGLVITDGPSITNIGINAGNKTITNVAQGVEGTDAVNVNQLTKATSGWILEAEGVTGQKAVQSGDTVRFVDGKNMEVTRTQADDGAELITYSTSDDVEFTTVNVTDNMTIADTTTINSGGIKTNEVVINHSTGDINVGDTLVKGITFTGDDGKSTEQKLGSELTVAGGDNITTSVEDGKLTVSLDQVVDLTKDGSLTIGDTKLTNDGLAITGGPSVIKSGIDAGNKTITSVASAIGTVKIADITDIAILNSAVNVGDLKSVVTEGLKFNANAGGPQTAALGSTVTVQGLGTVWSNFDGGQNIMTNITKGTDGNTAIDVALAKDLEDLNSIELGNSTGTPVTLGGNAEGSLVLNGGISDFAVKITNVAPGAINSGSRDAINGSQLQAMGDSLTQFFGEGINFEDGTFTWDSYFTNIFGEDSGITDLAGALEPWSISANGGNKTKVLPGDNVDLSGIPGSGGGSGSGSVGGSGNIVVELEQDANGDHNYTLELADNIHVNQSVTVGDTDGAYVAIGETDPGSEAGSVTFYGDPNKYANRPVASQTVNVGPGGVGSDQGVNDFTRLVYEDQDEVTHTLATLGDGLSFTGNTGDQIDAPLNSVVSIVGADTNTDWTGFDGGKNIMTQTTPDGQQIVIALSKNLEGLETIILGENGAPGKDGADGAPGIGLDGKDGVIGITGKDGVDGMPGLAGMPGASADITVKQGAPGIDGNDGEDGLSKTRIVYEKPDGTVEEVATLNDGLYFQGDVAGTDGNVARKLNQTLALSGGESDVANLVVGPNVGIVKNTAGDGYDFLLAKDLTGLNSIQLGGDTGAPVTLGGNSDGSLVINPGGDAAKITNVANGDISSTSTDAINGSQLQAMGDSLTQFFGEGINFEEGSFSWDSYFTNIFGEDSGITNLAGALEPWNAGSGGGNSQPVLPGDNVDISPVPGGGSGGTGGGTGAVGGSGNIVVNLDHDGPSHNYTLDLADDIHVGNSVTVGDTSGDYISMGNDGKAGSDGSLNFYGADGSSASQNIVAGPGGVGTDQSATDTTRLGYTDEAGNNYTFATLGDGLSFGANDGDQHDAALNTRVDIVGADTNTDWGKFDAGQNIMTQISTNDDGSGRVTVALANDLTVNSVTTETVSATTVNATTVNATTVNTDSITINNGGPTINKDGINMNDNRITNVAPGIDGTDAVNVDQLTAVNNNLQHQIDGNRHDIKRNNDRANAGIAAAMATAGLPQAYLPGKSMVAVAGGVWRGESGMAIGVSTVSDNGKWVLKGSANTSGRGGAGGTIGAGYQW